jgi:hypothetical protein
MTVRERLKTVPSAGAAQPMMISREQAAKEAGYSIGTLIRWEQLGILRPVKTHPGRNARVRYWYHEFVRALEGRH